MADPSSASSPALVPLTERLRAHARARPREPAFVWYGREIGWAELDEASDAFALRLKTLGLRRGDAVALYLGNHPDYVVAHLGIQKARGIVCPCGPLFKEHELHHQLDDLKARFIVAAAPLQPMVEKVRPRTALDHVFIVQLSDWLPSEPSIDVPSELLEAGAQTRVVPAGCEDFRTAASGADPAGRTALCDDPPTLQDVALMSYTSGTTGLPKGAMLTHENVAFKTDAVARCNGVQPGDVMLAAAPLYHIAGMLMGIDVTVAAGVTTVLFSRFDPRAALQAIERRRVTWWYSIAPMNLACMALPDAASFDLSSLRVNPQTSFGVTLTEDLARRWQALAPGCAVFEAAYGLTETHTCDTAMPRDAIRWGSHGKPVPGVRIRIVDPDTGEDRPTGSPGEIILASRGNFIGYWNKPEATARTLRDGWVHTGDVGVLDADGYLTFQGRIKEMIKVSGYSVFPEEVESMLVRHPAIAQAAVRGRPDERRGEVVHAFVVLRPGQATTQDDVIAWAREHMSTYKVPQCVTILQALPATGAGKVLRRLLDDTAP